jgi:hypothetical protein
MKIEPRDVGKLRWHALIAVALLAAATALTLWSTAGERKARSERDVEAGRKAQTEQRLRQVRTEEDEIKERTQRFQQMELAGIIGPELRLDWTELLRDLQHQLRLPGMTYEFGPQTPLETVSGAGYAYHSSQLRIQLRLLHEGDLLNFIERLQKEAKAMVLVRNCKVWRLPPTTAATDAAQLGAECMMEWVTLRRTSGTQRP